MAVGSGSRGVLLRFFSRRARGIQWSGGSGGLEQTSQGKMKCNHVEPRGTTKEKVDSSRIAKPVPHQQPADRLYNPKILYSMTSKHAQLDT